MPAKKKPRGQRARALPDAASFSLPQVAKQLRCHELDITNAVLHDELPAHVYLGGVQGRDAATRGDRWLPPAWYRLPWASARDVLLQPCPTAKPGTIEWLQYEYQLRLLHGQEPVTVHRRLVRPADVRVLREDLERFEAGTRSGTKGKTRGMKAKTDLQGMLSLAGKQARSEDQRKWAPVHAAVRTEFGRLRAEGLPKTKAAVAIVSDPAIREKIQAIASREGVQPWRRDFYSLTAIRKLVGG